MPEISDQIESAVEKFRNELLPKLPSVSQNEEDKNVLKGYLASLEKLHRESLNRPVFSVRFLGDTQNGKSTLINALLGRVVLPEGHVGACSATIVRCCYKKQPKITIRFRYSSEEQFVTDLAQKSADAEIALSEENSDAKKREAVCGLLGRFIRLLHIETDKVADAAELVELCRGLAVDFEERRLLGTEELLEVNPANEKQIKENLSAQGRRAFIVDECVIEGEFPDWHPALELVDMPGTNAFNPWDDQVNARLKQRIGGLAIITKETQLHDTVMDWFKESSIMPEIAGSSERNQVRVFVIKTFVDQLNLDNEDTERSQWDKTQAYCGEIASYLRDQVKALVEQRYSARNEVEALNAFVDRMPMHFVSPRVYRRLTNDSIRNRVLNNPLDHLEDAQAFQRFDRDPEKTGIPALKKALHGQTEEFINNHYLRKLRLDFEKEVGLVARFFRSQRVGIEQRLADQGAFVLAVDGELQAGLGAAFRKQRETSERKIVDLKNRFADEVGDLLDQVAREFGSKVLAKLEDWLQLHWASLRCAGRKQGQHITGRGYEIDFNGSLADFCVEALNSTWISYRANLRKLLYDDLQSSFLPTIEKTVAQAKGQDPVRQKLVESTYEEVAGSARAELELQVERYDSETEEFDALRPSLTMKIRKFLEPTYEGISSEFGRGSATRMRNHLEAGVHASSQEIGSLVKEVVKKNWEGLTGSVESKISDLLDGLEAQFAEQGAKLTAMAAHPSEGDEERVQKLIEIEEAVEQWKEKQAA
jgi:hypothetical protein